jgi:signal transduction histidine kinase
MLPFAKADIGLIERVFENLLQNAIYYTPQGGVIRLVLSPGKGDISVQVSDSGEGIPREALPFVFDRFYQLEKSQKKGEGHSGLGLAIAKKILELHERSIEVTSHPGSGTTFIFHIPVVDPV